MEDKWEGDFVKLPQERSFTARAAHFQSPKRAFAPQKKAREEITSNKQTDRLSLSDRQRERVVRKDLFCIFAAISYGFSCTCAKAIWENFFQSPFCSLSLSNQNSVEGGRKSGRSGETERKKEREREKGREKRDRERRKVVKNMKTKE